MDDSAGASGAGANNHGYPHVETVELPPDVEAALKAALVGDDQLDDLYSLADVKQVKVFLAENVDTDNRRRQQARERLRQLLDEAVELHVEVECVQRALALAEPNSLRGRAAAPYAANAVAAGGDFIAALSTVTDMYSFDRSVVARYVNSQPTSAGA